MDRRTKIRIIQRISEEMTRETTLGSLPPDPFRVLISTILSQRTRDENTARASRALFRLYPTPEAIASAPTGEVERLIRPSGFYRVKARLLQQVSRRILEEHGGEVPSGLEELLRLPGVGRKTANCVLVYGFRREAIPVDTHVHRISNRLGLVTTKTPEETEESLRSDVPRRLWLEINEGFVRFGREICHPLRPLCEECFLTAECRYYREVVVPRK
jgi:endonuclease-3